MRLHGFSQILSTLQLIEPPGSQSNLVYHLICDHYLPSPNPSCFTITCHGLSFNSPSLYSVFCFSQSVWETKGIRLSNAILNHDICKDGCLEWSKKRSEGLWQTIKKKRRQKIKLFPNTVGMLARCLWVCRAQRLPRRSGSFNGAVATGRRCQLLCCPSGAPSSKYILHDNHQIAFHYMLCIRADALTMSVRPSCERRKKEICFS